MTKPTCAAGVVAQERTSVADRYLIMGLASKLGWTNDHIRRKCRWLGKDAIQRWAQRGRAGWECADDEEREGRPRKLDKRDQRKLRLLLQNQRHATPAKVAAKLECAPMTVHREAKRLGLVPVKVTHRCRQSEAQRLYRIEWGEERKALGLDYWRKWVFSDEKWFYLVCKRSGEYVWVSKDDLQNEIRYVPKDKHPTKVMVWAGISYEGRTSLHVFPSDAKVDSVEYQYCMSEALIPAITDTDYLFPGGVPAQWIYMQDGAGPHRSKSTLLWLEKHLPEGCSLNDDNKWPAGSPDLNPIENLWNFFQNRVAEKDPKTIAEFKEILVDCWWKDISQEYIQRLYHSMPRRIAEMLGVDGKMTKY